jgi:hypothetical protein
LRRNGKVRRCTFVRVLFEIFARHPHRVWTEFACDRKISRLGPEKIVDY